MDEHIPYNYFDLTTVNQQQKYEDVPQKVSYYISGGKAEQLHYKDIFQKKSGSQEHQIGFWCLKVDNSNIQSQYTKTVA